MGILRFGQLAAAGLALLAAGPVAMAGGSLPDPDLPHAAVALLAESASPAEGGGFVAGQRLLFGGRAMTVAEASMAVDATVTAWTSSMAGVATTSEVAIARFVALTYSGSTVRIATWAGDELQVMPDQLLLTPTGQFVAARDVEVEMRLASTEGPVAVRQTWTSPYNGIIWRLQTVGATGTEVNTVVVGGLLAAAPVVRQ